MTDPLRPENEAQLCDAVASAVADGTTLELVGLGTKRGYGRPLQAARVLDLSALTGVRSYEAAELVLTAAAGTPLAEIEKLLAEQNQMLAFEPPDLSALLGSVSSGSIGGTIACNIAGPRRIKSGAARDHFLGAAAVSGRGEIFKAGGKVVKNVTGYDLCKLLAGSFGTLAAMEEVTIKVVPAPPKTRTVILFGLGLGEAAAVLADALNSPYDVSGAAYLPAALAARSAVDYVRRAGTAVTAFRLEGTAVSVAARTKALCAKVSYLAALEELHSMNSNLLWREIRDVAPLLPDPAKAIWRVSVAPSAGKRIAAVGGWEFLLDWGGGLVWLATDPAGDGGAAAIRAAVKQAGGGHATLLRAAPALRAAVPVFEPPDAALAALTARVKDGFDPKRVLNPGRMYPGV
jgi:glycolate oxidase FAD binding subunit